MEMELLNSKTEMMLLNNQLLEAVQHRLEICLELEAWKVHFYSTLLYTVPFGTHMRTHTYTVRMSVH